jgi:glycosyltransferase involved in cell wall biosynthesis
MTGNMLQGYSNPTTSILHVIGSMDPRLGGASHGLRSLMALLGRIGVRNEAVCMDDPCASEDGDDGLGIHRIGSAGNPWQYNPTLTPWLTQHAGGFDAVVIHGMWLHHGLAVSRWVKGLRRSGTGRAPLLLVMPHGMLDPWFQEAPGRRLKALRNSVYWRLVERSVVAAADAMLFTTEEERMRARTAFPRYPDVRERVVGFGTLPPPVYSDAGFAYPYTELPLGMDEPYLLYLGRIHEKKGADLLLDAYARLRDDRLPALLMAGPGWDSAFGRSLRERIAGDGFLTCKVHTDGMLSGRRKWQALQGCGALLLPSHHENFGVTVAEALSCGRPVLLSDKVNIHREVTGAGAGLSAPDDREGVLSLLSAWRSMQADERDAMSCAARTLFVQRFRMEDCARRILSVCRELLPQESATPRMPASLQTG